MDDRLVEYLSNRTLLFHAKMHEWKIEKKDFLYFITTRGLVKSDENMFSITFLLEVPSYFTMMGTIFPVFFDEKVLDLTFNWEAELSLKFILSSKEVIDYHSFINDSGLYLTQEDKAQIHSNIKKIILKALAKEYIERNFLWT